VAGLLRPCVIAVAAALGVGGGAHAPSAGGLDLDPPGARSVGRAGTQVVSSDGGAALIVNPAGLARRGDTRIQLAVAVHDEDADFRAAGAASANSPTVADRGAPGAAPMVAASASFGPVILGAAVLATGRIDRALPAPEIGQPAADVERLFPHRYGGLELSYRRRTAVLGAATRIGDWLGVGISAGASRVSLRERRRIWAGFGNRDPLGSPTRDLDLILAGEDSFVPLAAVGALVAPPDLPLELAIAGEWSGGLHLRGDAALARTSNESHPEPLTGPGARASSEVGAPTILRGGLRFLGERLIAEASGELSVYREAAKLPSWQLRDLGVRDETGVTASIEQVPSLVALRNHTAVRTAVDVEAVSGFLWLTAGYAFATAATSRTRLQPAFGDLGGHTAALGAEASWNQISFTLGVARQFTPAATVDDSESQQFLNPFDAGTAPSAAGRHRRARDTFGFSVEIAWD
jgi:hypothetical protein